MSLTEETPNLVGVGSIFIDDIVLPTGQTYMAQVGGGVLYALMGTVLWGERPGIVGLIGQGLPETASTFLHKHLDTRGLHTLHIPQARAWQLFEEDGTRREIPRVEHIQPFVTGPQPHHLPLDYTKSEAFYFIQGFEDMEVWSQTAQGLIFWEPLQQVMVVGKQDVMRRTLQNGKIDVVSPNLIEAQAVYERSSPSDLINAILDDGAQIVALRMGEKGSLIGDQDRREIYHIPATPVSQILDQTGAGNTYCGALLTGLMHNRSLQESACMAAVAASFCIEQVGILNPELTDPQERDKRYQETLKQVHRL